MINSGLPFLGQVPPPCGARLDMGFLFIDNRVVSVSSPKREGGGGRRDREESVN